MTYSPLSTPRSRAVVALLDKSKFSKHRTGQRKISEIVNENNALIKNILGLKLETESEDGPGPSSKEDESAVGLEGLGNDLTKEIERLEKKVQEQTAENIGLQRKVTRTTDEAKFFNTQCDKLLSYLSEDEVRNLRKVLFESEIERLGSEVAKLNEKNKELTERLQDKEKGIESSIEPRGLKHSRERWVENIMKAAELDYIQALGQHAPSTSQTSGSEATSMVSENGCHFMLNPTAAALEIARLQEKLDEMGRKVLIVEKARDSGYQENDYIDCKIKKVIDQTKLANEKLEQIKTFQRKLEELSKVQHQENILTAKRKSYSAFHKDKAKYYVPQFRLNIDQMVEQTSQLNPLAQGVEEDRRREVEEGAMGAEEDGVASAPSESVLHPKEEEEEKKILAQNAPAESTAADNEKKLQEEPKTKTDNKDDHVEEGQTEKEGDNAPAEPVLEESVPPIEEKKVEEIQVEQVDTPVTTPEKLESNTFAATESRPPPVPESSAIRMEAATVTEMGTQTPVSNPILDYANDGLQTPRSTSAKSARMTELQKIDKRLHEIKVRKSQAYRDLSTKTLRILAEEALEEKDLLKRRKKLQAKRRR